MLEYQEPEPRFISLIYSNICNLVEHEEIEINASKRKFQDSTKCQGQGESLPHTLSWVLIYFHEIASFPELSEQTYTFFLFVFVFILFYTKINSTVHSTPLHLRTFLEVPYLILPPLTCILPQLIPHVRSFECPMSLIILHLLNSPWLIAPTNTH